MDKQNNVHSENEQVLDKVIPFEQIKRQGNFEIEPCENGLNFEDKNLFKKINLSSEQRMQVSSLLQHLPSVIASDAMAQAYTVSFPDGLQHTLVALKQGGVGSMYQEGGKFAGTASLYSLSSQAALLGAFNAMSIASGQYFLSQINSELKMINLSLDKILEFLYTDKKAELMSEITFVKYAYQNYGTIMAHEHQQTATLTSLQEAKKVAMQDLEFYLNDLRSKSKEKFNGLSQVEKAFQIKEELDLAMQLYAISSLLEVYYSQNFEQEYLQYIEKETFSYIDKCDKCILASFSALGKDVQGLKGKGVFGKKAEADSYEKKINDLLELLSNTEDSAMKKSLRATLNAATRSSKYYLDKSGNLYCKKKQSV